MQSIAGKFYQFPHLTFQEYFVGRWLARKFSEEGVGQKKVREFLTNHKYDPQYTRTLSFLAGVVSNQISDQTPTEQQLSNFQELIALVGAAPLEVGGFQQALLEVGLLAECLCLVSSSVDEATLSKEFPVLNRLWKWCSKGFSLVRSYHIAE